jgi:hypothetical protein
MGKMEKAITANSYAYTIPLSTWATYLKNWNYTGKLDLEVAKTAKGTRLNAAKHGALEDYQLNGFIMLIRIFLWKATQQMCVKWQKKTEFQYPLR